MGWRVAKWIIGIVGLLEGGVTAVAVRAVYSYSVVVVADDNPSSLAGRVR